MTMVFHNSRNRRNDLCIKTAKFDAQRDLTIAEERQDARKTRRRRKTEMPNHVVSIRRRRIIGLLWETMRYVERHPVT